MEQLIFFGPLWGFLFHEALRFFPYSEDPTEFVRNKTKEYMVTSIILVILSIIFAEIFILESSAERVMIGFSITSGIGILKGSKIEKIDSDDHFNSDVGREPDPDDCVGIKPKNRSILGTVKRRLDQYYWY